MCNTNIQSKLLDWTQVTPLLVKADSVSITKQKISNTGEITTDECKWALSKINWEFKPVNKERVSIMEFVRITNTTQQEPEEDLGHEGLSVAELTTEKFDFLSGAFKFYFDTINKKLYGEIEAVETGFNVVYRYYFEFYGTQTITQKDFLVNPNATCYQVGNTNQVIAL